MTHFAAVQTQGVRPTVFGLGATADEARADAENWATDVDSLTVMPCSPELVAQVERGDTRCEIVDGVAVEA